MGRLKKLLPPGVLSDGKREETRGEVERGVPAAGEE